MKINRLYFEDFGILRNQAMEGIAGSPVVIAGPNRAGKTTIATALRYLAYGFPRQGAGLPSFVTQHRVEADVETADSFSYNISLKGHGSPDIRPLGRNNSRDLPQLYGEIDAFTYRQVFSISLDELKQVPEGLADRELENLQVLLLGGGWSDILRLEQIRAGLEKEYNVIGGKHGKIHVKQFGPYGGKVSEGQDELQEARKELESFYRQKDRLIEINNNMPCLVNDKKVLQNKVDRLEVIKEHFQHYRRMQELEKGLSQHEHQQLLENFPANAEQRAAELYREYEEAQAALEKAKKDLTLAAGFTNDREALQIALLNSGAKLDEFQLKLSGWRERITALKRGRAENSGEKKQLEEAISELNANWQLTELAQLEVDRVNESELQSQVEAYQEKEGEADSLRRELGQLKLRLEQAQKIKGLQSRSSEGVLKQVMLLTAADLVMTLAISLLITPSVAMVMGLVGGMAVYIYYQQRSGAINQQLREIKDTKNETAELEKQCELLNDRISAIEQDINLIGDALMEIRQKLGLPDSVAYHYLPDFCYRLRDLKRSYGRWQERGNNLIKEERALFEILTEIVSTLDSLGLDTGDKELISNGNYILDLADRANYYLRLARQVEEAKSKKVEQEQRLHRLLEQDPLGDADKNVEERLENFLERAQRCQVLQQEQLDYRNILNTLTTMLGTTRGKNLFTEGDTDIITAFGHSLNEFISHRQAAEAYEEAVEALQQVDAEYLRTTKEQTSLENEIQRLASDEKFRTARQKIDMAKGGLEPLAEKYAVLRLAELMTTKLKGRLMEDSQGSIFQGAGEIFRRVTGGDYDTILPPEDLKSLDFRAAMARSGEHLGVGALSRATREQLFLAVRLSRIQEIKPPLPVIFDDSFVNFDPVHCSKVVRMIVELSNTHQVFVLTCHPQLIDKLMVEAAAPQFWALEQGRLSGPYHDSAAIKSALQ